MKKPAKIIIILIAAVIVFLVGIAGFMVSHRERSFSDILPVDPNPDEALAMIKRADQESSLHLSPELFSQLIHDMEGFQYKRATKSKVMNSFGDVIYTIDGHPIEIMFSNERGGSILVNDIEKDRADPIYTIVGNDIPLEEFFNSYIEKAAKEQTETKN